MLNRAVQMLIDPDPTHGSRIGRDCATAKGLSGSAAMGPLTWSPRPGQVTLGEKWAASGQAPLVPGTGRVLAAGPHSRPGLGPSSPRLPP
jgi:hypothetical protein